MDISIKIPTSLAEIKLSDFQKFAKIEKDNEDRMFVLQKMVQIFCGVPLLAVTNMRRKDFVAISSSLADLLIQINKAQENKLKLIETIKLNGKQYGFIPSLDDMSFGEYIDLEESIKDVQTYHKAMAILFRPITIKKGGSYLIEDYKADDGLHMKDVSMDVVCGALVFFYRLGMDLLSVTPKYLEVLVKKNPKAAEALERNGVGINTYTQSLEEACLRLRLLLPYGLTKPYSSLPLKRTKTMK